MWVPQRTPPERNETIMSNPADLIDYDTLTEAGQRLLDTLSACATPGQVETATADAKVAEIKELLRAFGLTFKNNAKQVDVAPALAAEWLRLAEFEVPEIMTPEDILREEMAKQAAKRETAKAPKEIDPQAQARKERYAQVEQIKAAAMGEAKVTDREAVQWIMDVLTTDPGAVSAREMDYYRWVEGHKVGHQRWNGLWASAKRMIAEGLSFEVAQGEPEDEPEVPEVDEGDETPDETVTEQDDELSEPGDELVDATA